MKPFLSVLAALLFAPGFMLFGETNFFPVLQCQNRTYTNAHIGSVTPATVTVIWEGGGESIPITNLPPDLQQRFNYDPDEARKYQERIAAKKSGIATADAKTIAAIVAKKAQLGPQRVVMVTRIISPAHVLIFSEAGYEDAYVHQLPFDVMQFVQDYSATITQVTGQRFESASDTVRFKRSVGSGRNAVNVGVRQLIDESAVVLAARRDLDILRPQMPFKTTIFARPSEYSPAPGVRQWEFQRLAPPDTRLLGMNPSFLLP